MNQTRVPSTIRFGALRVARPFGRTLLMAAAALAVFVGIGEAGARAFGQKMGLQMPMLPEHYELGPKEFLAEQMAATGRIDCFFIGDSVVGWGIVPGVFEQAYQQASGEPLRCFNFGIDTLTFKGSQNLAEILERRYHPRLIVIGVHFENFTTSDSNKFDLETDWARTQLGRPTAEGVLESALVSYRYALTYAQTPHDIENGRILSATLNPSGYRLIGDVDDASKLTKATNPAFFRVIDTFDLEAYRGDLDAMLAADSHGTRIVLVDMPAPLATTNAIRRHGGDYDGYLALLPAEAAAHGVAYIPAIPAGMLPSNAYQDPSHMNTIGGQVYSVWLAQEIAKIGGVLKVRMGARLTSPRNLAPRDCSLSTFVERESPGNKNR